MATRRLETATGCSAWFGWARVGVDGLAPLAAATGFEFGDVWCDQARWFALLHSATRRPAGDPHRESSLPRRRSASDEQR